MAYQKYPWHRFQVWLRRKPDKEIAGRRGDHEHNVIATYLRRRVNPDFMVFTHAGVMRLPGAPGRVLPWWTARLLTKIEQGRPSRYTYGTVKAMLKEVSGEERRRA